MAQLNNIPTRCQGSVGDYTVYEREGKTYLRSRHNDTRRRPMGERQLRQCIVMGNAINLWRAFPAGQRPAFEHRREGVTHYNMFLTYAMQARPVYLTQQVKCDGGSVLADVVVSQGTLSEIEVRHDGTALATDILLGGLAIDSHTTVGRLAKAVIANNYDYQAGDRLLYYLALQRWNRLNDMPVTTVSCREVVLAPCDDRPLQEVVGDSPGFVQRFGRLAASREVEGGMAWVHLRPTDGGMLRSTQRMVCNNELINQFGSTAAFTQACQSYGSAQENDTL